MFYFIKSKLSCVQNFKVNAKLSKTFLKTANLDQVSQLSPWASLVFNFKWQRILCNDATCLTIKHTEYYFADFVSFVIWKSPFHLLLTPNFLLMFAARLEHALNNQEKASKNLYDPSSIYTNKWNFGKIKQKKKQKTFYSIHLFLYLL